MPSGDNDIGLLISNLGYWHATHRDACAPITSREERR
jgi:hypothetical protein